MLDLVNPVCDCVPTRRFGDTQILEQIAEKGLTANLLLAINSRDEDEVRFETLRREQLVKNTIK